MKYPIQLILVFLLAPGVTLPYAQGETASSGSREILQPVRYRALSEHMSVSQEPLPELKEIPPNRNLALAQIFTELTHDFEWGATRPHLVKFESPIRVEMSGPKASKYRSFFGEFLNEIRLNTDIDIAPGSSESANIHVRFVSSEMKKLIPGVQCLVALGDVDWQSFTRNPSRYGGIAISKMERAEDMTVFIPEDSDPILVKNCLREEILQSLGPANDNFSWSDSIFNDDNVHVRPTRFDYLMLRVLYDERMKTGMDRKHTLKQAYAILNELEPDWSKEPYDLPLNKQSTIIIRQKIAKIFSNPLSVTTRNLAKEVVSLAKLKMPNSTYHCHSLIVAGQVYGADQKFQNESESYFKSAEEVCRAVLGEGHPKIAHLYLYRSKALLKAERYQEAIDFAEKAAPTFEETGHEFMRQRFLSIRATARDALNSVKSDHARAERL